MTLTSPMIPMTPAPLPPPWPRAAMLMTMCFAALLTLGACERSPSSSAPPAATSDVAAATVVPAPPAATRPTTTVIEPDAPEPEVIPLPIPLTPMDTSSAPPSINFQPGPPRLFLSVDAHDFGVVNETGSRTTRIAFHNTGGETLVIDEVKTSCGCTTADLDVREYEPGEGGYLRVGFFPRGPGVQEKTVTLISNADPPVTTLGVRADVQRYLELLPRRLDFGIVAWKDEHNGSFTMSSEDEGYEIAWVRSNHEHVTARVATPEEYPRGTGKSDLFHVTIEPTAPWGPLNALVSVRVLGTDVPGRPPIVHTARVTVAAQLFDTLRVSPDTFRFGVERGEMFERTVTVAHMERTPFEIMSTPLSVVGLEDATVEVTAVSEFLYEVTLRARASDRRGKIEGTVSVRTNVPGEEDVIVIRIVGVVR